VFTGTVLVLPFPVHGDGSHASFSILSNGNTLAFRGSSGYLNKSQNKKPGDSVMNEPKIRASFCM
jgi:hypothetical protein